MRIDPVAPAADRDDAALRTGYRPAGTGVREGRAGLPSGTRGDPHFAGGHVIPEPQVAHGVPAEVEGGVGVDFGNEIRHHGMEHQEFLRPAPGGEFPAPPGMLRSRSKCKIGTTSDLGARLPKIYNGSSDPLELMATYPGGEELERALHAWFGLLRKHLEWF